MTVRGQEVELAVQRMSAAWCSRSDERSERSERSVTNQVNQVELSRD
jgi:hypothetical protein